ncbi:uncharacterized protein TRAVEDRAFT_47318 [Trametes versicolor FP-101664 SS1]|uniref:uncharacterized protein n=1 Tax=Trametes versicolor (strain FP-101664) TaxID=717944 RepID=UPI0004623C31|nr:uncharacterized protein TRAVEDRAFT_47318 [Trametes versicolor FP-101664 SS1]EIW58140.1 hypothetical protein TRAVEDRAFT_47318 [Trametes versicolor FP-101664 SS1]
MSLKTASVPIVDCATTIYGLASDVRNTHKAFDETHRQILRIPDQLKPPRLSSEWHIFSEQYNNIIHSSDSAATGVASNINVYLSLQGEIGEEDTDDMIEELAALIKDLAKVPTDMSAACTDLKRRLESCLRELTGAPASGGQGTPPAATNSATSKTQDQVKPTNLRQRAWGRMSNALAALQQIDQSKGSLNARSQSYAKDQSLSSNVQSRTPQAPHEVPEGGSASLTDAQNAPQPTAPTYIDGALVKSIQDIIASLEKQTNKFRAFADAAKHLENELNAYQSAFQAVKIYPTPVSAFLASSTTTAEDCTTAPLVWGTRSQEKRTALQNMHTRVGASARLWRELANVLTDGYARLQK